LPRRKKQDPIPLPIGQLPMDEHWWSLYVKNILGLNPAEMETVKTSEPKQSSVGLDPEMKIFAERLIYSLCPPEKGYSPVIVNKVKEIYDCLEGKKNFDEWFREVRQAFGLKTYQLAKIIYDCLEGLRSKEARELREQWLGYIQAELKGYGLL